MNRALDHDRFELRPQGPYSLAASIQFLEGFTPAGRPSTGVTDALDLAFVADGGHDVAGVRVRADGEVVVGEVFGAADGDVVRAQVARILSLDVDGRGFAAVGERDPVIGRLLARFPGLRPVCFCSPYEAGAWALLSHRVRMTQAARIKNRIAEEFGPVVEIAGTPHHAFPAPADLASLPTIPGVAERKANYLRHLARAAADGQLDAARLRAMPATEALADLKSLPGIGDFSAQLILLRGAGAPDELPTHEPRLARAIARAYGLAEPAAPDEIAALTDRWRPYRTWASFLLRADFEDERA